MRRRVHREGLDGTTDGNEAWRTEERRKRPCVRPATFETGSCSLGGVLGVLFSIPLRNVLIVQSQLPYPEGVAAASILMAALMWARLSP